MVWCLYHSRLKYFESSICLIKVDAGRKKKPVVSFLPIMKLNGLPTQPLFTTKVKPLFLDSCNYRMFINLSMLTWVKCNHSWPQREKYRQYFKIVNWFLLYKVRHYRVKLMPNAKKTSTNLQRRPQIRFPTVVDV